MQVSLCLQPLNYNINNPVVYKKCFYVLAGEANLFEEALQKYGKDFSDIQKDFVSSFMSFIIFSWFFYSDYLGEGECWGAMKCCQWSKAR